MSKKALFICFVALALLAVSGCSRQNNNQGDWRDEILLASECGLDGLPCCPQGDPCRYGQVCCSDPNNAKKNYCADTCVCGKEGKFCCAKEPRCGSGLACINGYCASCGEGGQPCCRGGVCRGGLLCHQDKCLQCGLGGNPCCAGSPACLNEDKRDDSRTECEDGICLACGVDGRKPCQSGPQCNPEHFLNNNVCLACGGFNQPCCPAGADYDCDSAEGLECERGFCSRQVENEK